MCDYCRKLFTGDVGESLIATEVGLGNTTRMFRIDTYLNDNTEEGEKRAYLITEMWASDYDIARGKVEIRYCPMCGRKLS